ncbi:MAG: DHH family phosphoesterase [Candidatus Nomurabacteria bacterium]|jgi:phosphoesterase RecJ-like protein|nr:DHH family phosphoesterase [Candidatus Nomurabacteria bacterium]
MEKEISKLISQATKIIVIQAENPDGDSIGSALALEEILGDLGKDVALYCPVQIPKYLRYISGWDRISNDFDTAADLAIIVDTTSKILLSKVLDDAAAANFLQKHPIIVFDHHKTAGDLPFNTLDIIDETAVATGEVILRNLDKFGGRLNPQAAAHLYVAIQSDTLGLTTENVTAATFRLAADLIDSGANPVELEKARRESMKKQPEILEYKGRLLERIDYHLDGRLAVIYIPWEEIAEYSDKYNPTMLVLDEMRQVIGVDVAIGIKTYPDGKLTGKIRANLPLAETIAAYFGGGGHPYAAGFRIYETLENFTPELLSATDKALKELS